MEGTKFEDYMQYYLSINDQDWIPIYEESKVSDEMLNDVFSYSALIDNDSIILEKYVEDYEWGFSTNSFGKSTFEKVYLSGKDRGIQFIAGDRKEHFEYLVAYRTFNKKYPSTVEINPKLIWYNNLAKVDNRYVDPDTDDTIIKVEKNRILVQKKYLRDFLSAHKKCCIICFDHRRFFNETGLGYKTQEHKGEFYNFTIVTNKYQYNHYNAMSSILGKTIIKPYDNPLHEDFRYFVDEKKYESFIIGENENTGEAISFTCEEDKLANYFGKNPESPHFLTPVYFSNKVLDKYRQDPSNYTVDDGLITNLDKWSIPFTINGDDKVVVWLGDLGRIPFKEQLHWKVYNHSPQGGIEKKFFQRQMLAQFTDSITPENKLFELINEINTKMTEKTGEKIFNELSGADEQIRSAFAIPTNNSVTQYQTYLMQLCKITVENINTRLIKDSLSKEDLVDSDGNLFGSRMQLKLYLEKVGIKGSGKLDNVLKTIYNSRNKLAGHKGSIAEYNKVWKRDKNYNPDFISDSKILLATLNNALNDIVEELI